MSVLRDQPRKILKQLSLDFKIEQPILIVEDDNSIALMLSSLISSQWQCKVHVANTYLETKNLLNQYRYDYHVALCDLILPDAPNGEVIDLVNKANVKFIVISGQDNPSMVKEVLNKGALDYIDKSNSNAYHYANNLVGRLYKNNFIKILIVEDSYTTSVSIELMLKSQNFQVLTASNGVQALELMNKHNDIKLVVTDYKMPEMDGFELILKLRKKFSEYELSIIGLSAVDDEWLSTTFIKNGANDFLAKPVTYNQLLCRANQNLDSLERIQQILFLANSDFLTQVYNRRYFFTVGNEKCIQAKLNDSPISIAMLDIDHFKSINDNYGHDCGDEVLVNFAKILREQFVNQLVARLGGEEFAIFFEDPDYQLLIEQLNLFREAIKHLVVTCNGQKISITVSIGVTINSDKDINSLLKLADDNLYLAKKSGRNKVISTSDENEKS